ncbi:DUF6153 family protein [Sinomonas mesophila]|uniref:DUF6153 family protein n=1 Tax=Sinomonas mesophila TaxID=1531955 RepID=UPI000984757C|nr:DUF6153 family protein [Sinomonas mesophila]
MEGQGFRRAARASYLGVLAAVLIVLGVMGMHGLSLSHAGMAGMAGDHAAAASTADQPASMLMGERTCPTEPQNPAANTGTVCVLAPPSPDSAQPLLPSEQPSLRADPAVAGFLSYRGPPLPAPSLHQLSISRT